MERNKMLKKITCFVLTAIIAAVTLIPTGVTAAGPTYSTRIFIEWTRVKYYSDLPTDTKHNYYMFLAWTSDNKNPNDHKPTDTAWYCVTDMTGTYDSGTDALIGAQLATTNYGQIFSVDKDKFITSCPYGMPKIVYQGKDGDNNSCPEYTIQLNEGKGNYVLEDGGENFKFRSSGGSYWGVAVQEPGSSGNTKYEQSADYDGTVCLYYNRSDAKDSGFVFHGEKVVCPKDKDYDDFDSFVMWVGREVKYSCINSDYTVRPGDVFDIKNDGIVVENGVTLTINPGATLSISGVCVNNGQILNCGTLIVQRGGAIYPMPKPTNPRGNDVFDISSNSIKCVGGSDSVSVSGYRKKIRCEGTFLNFGSVGFSKKMGSLKLYSGATVENYGFMICGTDLYVSDSSINNYGYVAVGVELNGLTTFEYFNPKLPPPPLTAISAESLNFQVLGKSVIQNRVDGQSTVCKDATLTKKYFTYN